ncbi:hypothetical protein [Pontibacter arcticus]|uniref:Uncharacterized protein n=1 Tax=Pontibacter arcticus TaxID=2080288 RepID=A0A364RJ06_9BACT|nr:hypothetical protein [Pontibacter arcticus]RAU84310.1 hypothetical protein DP923_04515 [Pontibacter arcticus]
MKPASYLLSVLSVLLLTLTGCERPATPVATNGEAAYNLTAYLQEQQQMLQAQKPTVLKSVQTEDKPVETIETDSLDWVDELAIFEELDLNRPTLLEYYTLKETALDDGGTLLTYTRLPDAAALVHYMQLHLSEDRKLRKLEGVIQDKNILFYTSRNLKLEANPTTGNVESYEVDGVQKLFFGDSLHYRIVAHL